MTSPLPAKFCIATLPPHPQGENGVYHSTHRCFGRGSAALRLEARLAIAQPVQKACSVAAAVCAQQVAVQSCCPLLALVVTLAVVLHKVYQVMQMLANWRWGFLFVGG